MTDAPQTRTIDLTDPTFIFDAEISQAQCEYQAANDAYMQAPNPPPDTLPSTEALRWMCEANDRRLSAIEAYLRVIALKLTPAQSTPQESEKV